MRCPVTPTNYNEDVNIAVVRCVNASNLSQ